MNSDREERKHGCEMEKIKIDLLSTESKEKNKQQKKNEEPKKEIFLDDNLEIKKDLEEAAEKEPVSHTAQEQTEGFGGIAKHLDAVSVWFADKYESLMELLREPTNDLESYKYRVRKEKLLRIAKIAGVSLAAFLVIFAAKYFIEHHSYDSYSVISMSEKVDTGVAHFLEMDGKILHYSADGASLTSAEDELIWADSYQMSRPMVESFHSIAAIYDQKGTQIVVYDEKGKLGSFQTEHPIMKASVSAKGEVAAILEDGETTFINYYTETGSLIASSATNMRNPGYPVDLSVSKDGLSVAVTYFVVDEDTVSSYLAFYNFGNAGRKKEDNLLGGVRCAGVLVPEIQYLDNHRVIAYSENGFKIFKVKSDPEAETEVIFNDDIVSSFCDGEYIGFVFRNNDQEKPFLMKVFRANGKQIMETAFDIAYDDIKISGDKIILNNATQMEIYSLKGIQKYAGTIEEGNIHEIVKVGMNKYVVAYNGGVVTIKLK